MRRAPKAMTRAGLIMVLIASLAVVVPALAASGRSLLSTQHAVNAATTKVAVRRAAVHTAAVLPPLYLCAVASSPLIPTDGLLMADGSRVDIWGFALDPNQLVGGGCALATPGLPGPTLGVDTPTITEGDVVTVVLENTLAEPVSINFHGQNIGGPPDTVGAPALVGTKSYSFTAVAGTFLYESGTDVEHQIPMGLAGALVVHSTVAGQVYSTNPLGQNTTFNQEAVAVLSDIDPALNAAVSNGNAFDMLNYKPQYWLINGKSYPNTAPIVAGGLAGWRIDLRVVNAGLQQHTLMLLGAHASFVARDGFAINYPYDLDAETFAAGTTGDAIMTIPTGTGSGARFALYSRNMDLTNGLNVPANTNYSPGGMMTFITVP